MGRFWNKTVPYGWEKDRKPEKLSFFSCKWFGCNIHKVKCPYWWSDHYTWNRKICIRCLKIKKTSDK